MVGDHGISNALLGDGFCNDEINTPECGHDGFDCCGVNVLDDKCRECICHGNTCFNDQHQHCQQNYKFLQFYLTFLQILLPDVNGQETLMKQHGGAVQAQTLVGYLKEIVMEMMSALATSYVDLTTVFIHFHLLLIAATTH